MAKDVCEGLGFSQTFNAMRMLENDEKNTLHISNGIPGNPVVAIVSEASLYSLILRSRRPEAMRMVDEDEKNTVLIAHGIPGNPKRKRVVSVQHLAERKPLGCP